MATPPLLNVTTPFISVEVHGRRDSRMGTLLGEAPIVAKLAIETSTGPIVATWSGTGEVLNSWSKGLGGPHFFEETTYRLHAKALVGDRPPTLTHRDPYLLQGIDPYPADRVCVGPINFQRQVGLSTLTFRVGNETLRLTIEVFPVKLDYERDYQTLLSAVASSSRGLALEYLRATYRQGATEETEQATDLEWVTLLRAQITAIDRAVRYVNDHPQRALIREAEIIPVEKIKRSDASVRRAIIQGRGQGPWLDVPSIGRVRGILLAVGSRETLATPEHRWLRFSLISIRARLAELHAAAVAEMPRARDATRAIPQRLEKEKEELSSFLVALDQLLTLPVFEGVQGAPLPGFASLTLLGGIGYRDAYRAIMVLRLGLSVDAGALDLSVMDVHHLYEAWCFIELIQIVARLTGGQADLTKLLQVERTGIRVRLRQGSKSRVGYDTTVPKIEVLYNQTYPGLTGAQRPDVVLRFRYAGWPDLIVVFDAKYRLRATAEYVRQFKMPGPPPDAINALHRYRDAIVLGDRERGRRRPVVKGAALFPLPEKECGNFAASRFQEALAVLGIGALPFLPGNTGFVEAWLRGLLALSPDELAEPGPPFAGLAEKHRRTLASAKVL